jgi:hypothetical protein
MGKAIRMRLLIWSLFLALAIFDAVNLTTIIRLAVATQGIVPGAAG